MRRIDSFILQLEEMNKRREERALEQTYFFDVDKIRIMTGANLLPVVNVSNQSKHFLILGDDCKIKGCSCKDFYYRGYPTSRRVDTLEEKYQAACKHIKAAIVEFLLDLSAQSLRLDEDSLQID